ncbi:acyltransferase family protein [Leifsonia sp. TF02-11]|uniref:acyltransferase family protein n=1 Tax=Leifsonia sp. TF02-11 TaxID=2815212 RepID=UPI001AA113A4|nr:acyltransferase [Leifsonia sp. TF02-11]MBO1740842.1 acyltransferase [Leifsonia sp. TF02-11]
MPTTAPKPAPASSTKDTSIETLRGLACILVVMAHSPGLAGPTALNYADDPWKFGLDLLAYLRMPLFTFLSGYVYAIRPITTGTRPWRFLRAKTRRLMLPMLVVGTVFMIAIDLMPGWSPGEGIRPWWMWHIVPVAQFWFIWAIFWCFLVVAYLDYRGWLSRRSWMLTAIVVVYIASSILPKGVSTPFGILPALYLALFFLAGIACRRFDWRAAPRKWHLLVLGAFVVIGCITVALNLAGIWPPVHGWIGNLVGVLSCMLLLRLRFSFRPLAWLGPHSYPIFLFHFLFIELWRMVLVALGVVDVTISILSTTAVALAGSLVLERILRSWRISRLLALGERWTSRASSRAHSHVTSSPPPLNSPRPHTKRIGDP